MFDRLVRIHGNLLVNHALGYLTVAKFGLTGSILVHVDFLLLLFYQLIVNRRKWLGSPANIKGANKEAKIEVGRSMTVHIFCFALIHYA